MQWIIGTIHKELEKLPAFKEWELILSETRLVITNTNCTHDDRKESGYHSGTYPKITITTVPNVGIMISGTVLAIKPKTLDISNPDVTQESIIAEIQHIQSRILSSKLCWVTN